MSDCLRPNCPICTKKHDTQYKKRLDSLARTMRHRQDLTTITHLDVESGQGKSMSMEWEILVGAKW